MSWSIYLLNMPVEGLPEEDFVQNQKIDLERILTVNALPTGSEIQLAFELLDGVNGNRLVGPKDAPGSFLVQPLKINTAKEHHLILIEDEEKEFLAYHVGCFVVYSTDQIAFRIAGAADIPLGVTHYNLWVRNV